MLTVNTLKIRGIKWCTSDTLNAKMTYRCNFRLQLLLVGGICSCLQLLALDTYTRMLASIYQVCVSAYACKVYISSRCECVCACAFAYVRMCVCACVSVCVRVYVCIWLFVCLFVCAHKKPTFSASPRETACSAPSRSVRRRSSSFTAPIRRM